MEVKKLKKIVLKTEACIGCGACIGNDPEHFKFDDMGFSIVKSQENLESPSLSDAIDACPVAIISIEEVSEENNIESKTTDGEKNHECSECHCDECHCNNEEKKAA